MRTDGRRILIDCHPVDIVTTVVEEDKAQVCLTRMSMDFNNPFKRSIARLACHTPNLSHKAL